MIKEGNPSIGISNSSAVQVYFDRDIGLLGHPFNFPNSSPWESLSTKYDVS